MGGFGEGLAVLAAAGGPDVHPHATDDDPDEWVVWERDVAHFREDLPRLDLFFRRILDGNLSGEALQREGFTFIATDDVPQGAFYTVGWKMASMVEKARGRQAVVDTMCDMRKLLVDYNEVAAEHSRAGSDVLPMWSSELLRGLGAIP